MSQYDDGYTEAEFMKKSGNTEAQLKKTLLIKKRVYRKAKYDASKLISSKKKQAFFEEKPS